MRGILTLVLLLGVATIVFAGLQRADEIARWSTVYALFDQPGGGSPLQLKEVRGQFDAIVMRMNPFATALSGTGLATCLVGVVGLWLTSKGDHGTSQR